MFLRDRMTKRFCAVGLFASLFARGLFFYRFPDSEAPSCPATNGKPFRLPSPRGLISRRVAGCLPLGVNAGCVVFNCVDLSTVRLPAYSRSMTRPVCGA